MWRCVFVGSLQTRVAYKEIAYRYGEFVSGQSVYAYVNGNPISLGDPDGLFGTALGGLTRGNTLNDAVQQGAPLVATGKIAAGIVGPQTVVANTPSALLAISGSVAAIPAIATSPGLKTVVEIIDAIVEISGVISGNPQTPTPPSMDPASHVERAKNPFPTLRNPPSCRR